MSEALAEGREEYLRKGNPRETLLVTRAECQEIFARLDRAEREMAALKERLEHQEQMIRESFAEAEMVFTKKMSCGHPFACAKLMPADGFDSPHVLKCSVCADLAAAKVIEIELRRQMAAWEKAAAEQENRLREIVEKCNISAIDQVNGKPGEYESIMDVADAIEAALASGGKP